MKLFFLIALLVACNSLLAQSSLIYKGDTINRVDAKNFKQGMWITFDSSKTNKVEEGSYLNNQKHGTWTSFYPNGRVKNSITYDRGMPRGKASFYFEDGKLWEEGTWDIDHWSGPYKFYHKNGKLAYDWNYNPQGKRVGTQKYFYENGATKYVGQWENGKTVGALKVYNEEGKLMAERVYEDGKFADTIEYETPSTQQTASKFNGTGNHTVYNINQKIEWHGFFVKGKLYNGTHYIYNNNGDLLEKEVWENGVIVRTDKSNTL